jgi:hypothetical protein
MVIKSCLKVKSIQNHFRFFFFRIAFQWWDQTNWHEWWKRIRVEIVGMLIFFKFDAFNNWFIGD